LISIAETSHFGCGFGTVDKDRRDLARWSISAAVALLAHGLIAILALHWQPEAGAVEPTATIVIELSPLLSAPKAQDLEAPPVPQQAQAENPPDEIVEKHIEKAEIVAKENYTTTVSPVLSKVREDGEVDRAEPPAQKFETVEIEERSEVELPQLPEKNDKIRIDMPRSEPGNIKQHEQTAQPKPIKQAPDKPQRPAVTLAATKPQTAQAREAATPQAPALSTPSNSNALPNWKSQVIGILERNKRYPSEAQARQERGTSNLAFSLNRQGRVTSAHIAGSSGSPTLDAETLSLVHRVQPFPPPPPEVAGAQISLLVAIRYNAR
jgi:protein TonB